MPQRHGAHFKRPDTFVNRQKGSVSDDPLIIDRFRIAGNVQQRFHGFNYGASSLRKLMLVLK